MRPSGPFPLDDATTRAALARERRILRWAARGEPEQSRLHVPVRESLELADLSDYGGFGDGWAYPDEAGIWTQGSPSTLALDGIGDSDYVLAFSLGSICVRPDETLKVKALVNGERVAAREFRYGDPEWHIELPAHLSADGEVDLAIEIEELRTPLELGWSDGRRPAGRASPSHDDAAAGRR